MIISLFNSWLFFLGCFGLALVTTAFMSRLSVDFFTKSTMRKRFSIFDLEFPASASAISTLIINIALLGESEAAKVKLALRRQLYIDFLFMPGIYLSVAFLCHKTTCLMASVGGIVFSILAMLQLLAWLCDITENIVLLKQISKPGVFTPGQYTAWYIMEGTKWGLSLIGGFASLGALLFFWFRSQFHTINLWYILPFAAEVFFYSLLTKWLKPKHA